MSREKTWEDFQRSQTGFIRTSVQEAVNAALMSELKREKKSMETVEALDRFQARVMVLVREAFPL